MNELTFPHTRPKPRYLGTLANHKWQGDYIFLMVDFSIDRMTDNVTTFEKIIIGPVVTGGMILFGGMFLSDGSMWGVLPLLFGVGFGLIWIRSILPDYWFS